MKLANLLLIISN